MEKTFNSGKSFQKWPASQNSCKSTSMTYLKSQKEPRQTSKELYASFTSDKVSIHDFAMRKKPLLTKSNINTLVTPSLLDNALVTDESKNGTF